jgi:chromosome segregation ATPase
LNCSIRFYQVKIDEIGRQFTDLLIYKDLNKELNSKLTDQQTEIKRLETLIISTKTEKKREKTPPPVCQSDPNSDSNVMLQLFNEIGFDILGMNNDLDISKSIFLTKLKTIKDDYETKIANLSEKLDRSDSLLKDVATFEEEMKLKVEQILTLEQRIADYSSIEEKLVVIESLEQQITQNKEQLDQKIADNSTLEENLNEKAIQIKRLEQKLSNYSILEEQLAEKTTRIEELVQKIGETSTFEERMLEKTAQIEQLQANNLELDNNSKIALNLLNGLIQEQQTHIDQLKAEKEAGEVYQSLQVTSLTAEKDECEQRCESLKVELSNSNDKLTILLKDFATIEEELQIKHTQIQSLEQKITEFSNTIEQLQAEKLELENNSKTTVNELNEKVELIQTEIDQLKAEKVSLEENQTNQTAEKEECEQRCESLKAKLITMEESIT